MASTTLAEPAAMEPDEKVPAVPTKVPASDESAASGVTAAFPWFLPQMVMTRVLPPGAVLFGEGHALPGAGDDVPTTASSTSHT